MDKDEKGREVLQHQATQERETLNGKLCADYCPLTDDSIIPDALRREWAHAVAPYDDGVGA